MKKVLITGGIASGKSEVCKYLISKGYPVYDSDSRAKALYASVPNLKETVESALALPFEKLSQVFSDPSRLHILEGIIHPLVLKDFLDWAGNQDAETVFFESAIATQKPLFDGVFDEVILVESQLETRQRRNPKVLERAHIQYYDSSKVNHVITNDSDLENLYRQIDNII